MGYQEAILHIRGKKNQIKFIKELYENYGNNWNSLAKPEFIIETKKELNLKDFNRYKVKKDEKLIYIIGERSHQRTIRSFLWNKYNSFKSINTIFFMYNILPIEDCIDFMENIILEEKESLDEIESYENQFIKITSFKSFRKIFLNN